MARLVLLTCVLALTGCRTSLGDHLPTSSDTETVFLQPASKEVRTSLRIKPEDYADLTSFPDMVGSDLDSMSSQTVKFGETRGQRARPWGGAFDGIVGSCDPCCAPGEHASDFFAIRRRRR